jgi:fructokinase
MRILSFGEILWDQIDGHEHLGGAPLNFSVASQRLGGETFLVSGVGTDQHGCLALERIRAHSLDTRFIQQLPDFPTGIATVVKNSTGNASFSIPRPAAFDRLSVTSKQIEALCQIKPEWIYMGTLAQTTDSTFQLLQQCRKQLPETRCFYDINLRKGHWNLEIVQRLSALRRSVNFPSLMGRFRSKLFAVTGAALGTFPFCALPVAQKAVPSGIPNNSRNFLDMR